MLQDEDSDIEDIFSSSLAMLYGYTPVSHSSPGKIFTYIAKSTSSSGTPLVLTVRTPDTQAANWGLHASSIWVASLYLADHLADLCLDSYTASSPGKNIRVLELGAGAGLPSILIAKTYHAVKMTASDFPDDDLIRTLSDNIRNNGVSDRCRVIPYAWGSD